MTEHLIPLNWFKFRLNWVLSQCNIIITTSSVCYSHKMFHKTCFSLLVRQTKRITKHTWFSTCFYTFHACHTWFVLVSSCDMWWIRLLLSRYLSNRLSLALWTLSQYLHFQCEISNNFFLCHMKECYTFELKIRNMYFKDRYSPVRCVLTLIFAKIYLKEKIYKFT